MPRASATWKSQMLRFGSWYEAIRIGSGALLALLAVPPAWPPSIEQADTHDASTTSTGTRYRAATRRGPPREIGAFAVTVLALAGDRIFDLPGAVNTKVSASPT